MVTIHLSEDARGFLLAAFHPKISPPQVLSDCQVVWRSDRMSGMVGHVFQERLENALLELTRRGLLDRSADGEYVCTVEGHRAIIELLESGFTPG